MHHHFILGCKVIKFLTWEINLANYLKICGHRCCLNKSYRLKMVTKPVKKITIVDHLTTVNTTTNWMLLARLHTRERPGT